MVEMVLDFGEIWAMNSFFGNPDCCGGGGVGGCRDVACNVSTGMGGVRMAESASSFNTKIPCMWLGITTNAPNSTFWVWFLISCQNTSAKTPQGDNIILSFLISPKKCSLFWVQMVIK